MAYVSNIRKIINNTFADMDFVNGENTSQTIRVYANSTWSGDLWVPWIGRQDEGSKTIKIISPTASKVLVYIFQDYWHPADANAIKYCNDVFSYRNAQEISGDNRGGGDKQLVINADVTGDTITLSIQKL
ncbi:hypothetical protein [Photorhabdus luminescens]|uniref:Uncharacterized protein n=1 Tax=Photorhabdus luminescens subsp. mexicana TaxID=2100167 RepID=A0A4R4ITJ2_PHOLU|nr:hypothetical protein [Photorhabdus luminescens]TDB44157.1 hypothetical protein C5468_22940 [Photorhabdus luminescens subsp. mexicana]